MLPNLLTFGVADPSLKNAWATHTSRPVPVYYQGAGSAIIEEFKGAGYQIYGQEVGGVSNFIDQTHIGKAQIEALGGIVPQNLSGQLFGMEWQLTLIVLLTVGLGMSLLAKLRV